MDNELMVKTIRELCIKNNISISQLENDLEFGAGLVSRWTKSSPSIDKIVDIADYFHVSLDEVIGYQNMVNDKFLEKLIRQTVNKTISWNKYNKDVHEQPLHYYNPDAYAEPEDFIDIRQYYDFIDSHKEISYFVKINNVYILLYACYKYQNIMNPLEIKLFIQPDDNAQLIEQDYTDDQLKVLWLKALFALGENAPDEIKAEEFKNAFINDFKKPEPPKKKKNIIFVSNPQNNKNVKPPLQKAGYNNSAVTQRKINKSISQSVSDIVEKNNQENVCSDNSNISQTEE